MWLGISRSGIDLFAAIISRADQFTGEYAFAGIAV